ncbi:MAG: hypothetical protein WBA31_06835 [Candidatus Dormiibacterota bacterium]
MGTGLAVGLCVSIVLVGGTSVSASTREPVARRAVLLAADKPTKIFVLSDFWHAAGVLGRPLLTSCRAAGKEVDIHGGLGPERVDIRLRGLHPGKHYLFLAYQTPVSATLRVTETGPVDAQRYAKGFTDFLGPAAGVEGNGSGSLTVAANGRSGSLAVTLPKNDSLTGRWTCGSDGGPGASTPPTLLPATSSPVVKECALGSSSSNPPPAVTCADGDLNVEAWSGNGAVEAAGRKATLSKVEAAICLDQQTLSTTVPPTQVPLSLENEYAVAAVYYGWHFALSPAAIVAAANCPG